MDGHSTGCIGSFSTIAKNRLKVSASEKNLGFRVVSQMRSFRFSVRVSELHIQCLLNMSQLINLEKVDKVEGQVRTSLE